MTFEEWLRSYKKKVADFADIALNFDDSDMKEAFNAGQESLDLFKETQKELWEKYEELSKVKEQLQNCVHADNSKVIEELQKEVEKYRWHYPSKGELPEGGAEVLVYVIHERETILRRRKEFFLATYNKSYGWWIEIYGWLATLSPDAFYKPHIVAWQYLPEPPKEDDNV